MHTEYGILRGTQSLDQTWVCLKTRSSEKELAVTNGILTGVLNMHSAGVGGIIAMLINVLQLSKACKD